MKRAVVAVLAAVCLLAGGCRTAGPDYAAPAASLPAAWTTAAGAGLTHEPLDPAGLGRWWTVFRDPVLTGLVAEARSNSLDLKQAEARLQQARAQRGLSGAALWPTVSAGASAGRARSSATTGNGATRSSYAHTVDASWDLDLSGAKRRANEAAEASLQASEAALHDVMVSLLAEVALNYVEYRSAQVRLAITATNLAAQAETCAIAGWRQQANLVTQLDVDQARMSLEQTRAELPALQAGMDQAEHQLATLLGVAPGTLSARLQAGPAAVPVAAATVALGAPADVVRQRPDVRESERKLAAQTAQIGVAAAARYPTLALSGSIGLEALTLGDLYTAGARTAQGLAKAGIALFDGGRIRQNIAIQTALQEEALAAYQAAVLAALRDVEDALTAYVGEQARQQALQEAVGAAESACRLARDKYASGLADFTTVLTAQQALLTAQNALASSHAAVTSDLIRLYKAMGGGWTPAADERGTNADVR